MNPNPMLAKVEPRLEAATKPKRDRLFYAGAAALFLVLMLLGFQKYYLHGKLADGSDIPAVRQTPLLLHAIAMSAWVVLFFVQSLLIAGGRRRVHMAIGRFGAVLAVTMVVLGAWVAIQRASLARPEDRSGFLTAKAFCLFALCSVVLFGVFVTVAVYSRRRPWIHRPMMLMATLIVLPAAIDRFEPIYGLYGGTVWEKAIGPHLSVFVIAALLLVVKWLVTRSFDRWFAIAYGSMVASLLLVWRVANTDAWERLAAQVF
jgi:uncharacterized membrane protein